MPEQPASPKRRHVGRWVVGGVIAAVVALGAFAVWAFVQANKNPSFPSLADSPDSSLQGTVAFGNYDCIRVVSMSGQPLRDVACEGLGGDGQPYIAEVVWLPDGRLQAISYGDPRYDIPVWSSIYDLRTGDVEEVPASEVPDEGTLPEPVTESPDGRRVASSSDGGHVEVTLTGPDGARTLMEADGGSHYAIGDPVWSADFESVLVHDTADRILLITTGDQPTTRVLVEGAILWGSTAEDLLDESG
jgi:hypothetical protein